MAERLRRLAPTTDLIITDPYLFTSSRKNDSEVYAASVGDMMEPALTMGLQGTLPRRRRRRRPPARSPGTPT